MVKIAGPVELYLLPERAEEARSALLRILQDPHPTWMSCYGLSFEPLVDEVLTAHARGVEVHVLVDHTQACGPSVRPVVQRLVDAGVDVVIGVSEVHGRIDHDKLIVSLAPEGAAAVGNGSLNFTNPAFDENNMFYVWTDRSAAEYLAQRIVDQHEHPEWQVAPTEQDHA